MSVSLRKKEILTKAYEEYSDALFRYCLVKLSLRERALDVVQETFVRAWQYLKHDDVANMKSFLFTTAHHLIIDDYRKKHTESLDAMADDGFDIAGGYDVPLLSVDAERALKALHKLEPLYKDIMILRFVNGLAPVEISEITGLSENVVSVRIHRALEQLRTMLNITHE